MADSQQQGSAQPQQALAMLPSLGQLVPALGPQGSQPNAPSATATPTTTAPAAAASSAQPNPDLVPVFSPQGQFGHVSRSQLQSALDSNGQRALPVVSPQGQQGWVPEQRYQQALASGGQPDTQQLTSNSAGEGLYNMIDSKGQRWQVPFSKVRTAQAMQFALDSGGATGPITDRADDAARYEKDLASSQSQPGLLSRMGTAMQQNLESNTQFVPTKVSSSPTALGSLNIPTAMGTIDMPAVSGLVNIPAAVQNFGAATAKVVAATPGFLQNLGAAAKQSVKSGDPSAVLDVLDPMPMLQGVGQQFTEDMKAGDPALATERLMGTAAGLYLAGKAGGKVGEAVKDATGNVIGKVAYVPAAVKATISSLSGTDQALSKAATKYVDDVQQAAVARANESQRSADAQQDLADKAARINAAKQQAYDQRVIDLNKAAQDEHAAAVQAVQQHNAQVKSDWQADVARTQQENEGLEQALDLYNQTQQQFDQKTQALKERQDALDAEALAGVNQKWNGLRQAITKPMDLDPVKAAIKRVEQKMTPESVALFRQIMQTGSDAAEVDALRQKIMAQTPGLPRVQEGNTFRPPTYEELPPELQQAIDGVVNNQAAVEGIDPEATADVSFGKFHSWVTELGHKIYRGSYDIPGNIKSGLRDVYIAAKKAEDAAARDAGVSGDLDDARAATRDYKQAFGIPEKSRPTIDTQLLQKTNPELFAKQARQAQIDAVAKYDPSIKDAYADLDRVKQLHEQLADPEQLRRKLQQVPAEPVDKYKPVPEPPTPKLPAAPKPYEQSEAYISAAKSAEPKDIPDPEPMHVEAIKQAAINSAINRWKLLDKWQVRMLMHSTGGAALGGIMGFMIGGGEGAGIGSVVGGTLQAMAPRIFASAIDHSTFVNWLAKGPTPRDLTIMSKIPSADLIRMKDNMTGQVVSMAQAGQHFDISPKTAKFLGPLRTERVLQAMAGGIRPATAQGGAAAASATLPQAAQSQPPQSQPQQPQQPPSPSSAQPVPAGVTPQ